MKQRFQHKNSYGSDHNKLTQNNIVLITKQWLPAS